MPAYVVTPLAAAALSFTQSQMMSNFISIQQLIDINHADFADGVNYGKHNVVTFPVQLLANLPTFLAGEVALYNMLPVAPYPLTGVDELFINKTSGASVVQVPFTASVLSYDSAPGTASNGYTYLPSGILVKWGISVPFNRNAVFGLVFDTGTQIPVFNQVFSMQATNYCAGTPTSTNSNVIMNVGAFTTAGCDLYANGPAGAQVQASYLAIGF
jgi:hypothetical protein